MSTILDADVLLLLATALAAKRRPAELPEIVAAIDLIQGKFPGEEKLVEAFAHLGRMACLREAEGGVALTERAEKLIEGLSRKGDHAAHLYELRGLLAAQAAVAEGAPVLVTGEAVVAALQAYRASAAGRSKNLLVPKPNPEAAQARPGQRQRKPMPKAKSRKR